MFKFLERKSSFLQAIRVIFFFDIFVRIIQFIRELIFSTFYGFSRVTDAFNYTVNILGTPINLIADALLVGIIPALNKKNTMQEKINYVFSLLITFFCIIFSLFFLFFIFYQHIMKFLAPGFDPDTLDLTFQFSLLYAVIGLLTVFNRIFDNFFKAEKVFALFNFSNLISAILSIIVLLLLFKLTPLAITVGMLVGALVGFSLLFIRLPLKKMTSFDKDAVTLIKRSIPLLLSGGLGVINTFVDKSFSTVFEAGILTILSYATMIVTLTGSILTNAIGGASYSFIASEIAENKKESVINRVNQINFFFLSIFSLICLGFIVLGFFFLKIVFLRGAITAEDIDILYKLTLIFLPSTIFSSIGTIVLQVFYSYDNLKVTTIVNSLCVILQIVFNILFIDTLGYYTLAISFALSSLLSTTINGYLLHRIYGITAFHYRFFLFSLVISLVTPSAILINDVWILLWMILIVIIIYLVLCKGEIKEYKQKIVLFIKEKYRN